MLESKLFESVIKEARRRKGGVGYDAIMERLESISPDPSFLFDLARDMWIDDEDVIDNMHDFDEWELMDLIANFGDEKGWTEKELEKASRLVTLGYLEDDEEELLL